MFEKLMSPDQVAAVKISGTMTGADYDQMIAEVECKLARHEKIGVLLDLSEFKDFTCDAAWKDIKYDVSKFHELKRFPREAIITDKAWMRVAAEIADPLIPHVAIRPFGPNEREAAMAWVAEVDA
jgi:hypothetical protein